MVTFNKLNKKDCGKDYIVIFEYCDEKRTFDDCRYTSYRQDFKMMDKKELIKYVKENGTKDIYLVSKNNRIGIEQIVNIKDV